MREQSRDDKEDGGAEEAGVDGCNDECNFMT